MRAVLASIQPKWCVKIASHMKSVEVRKNAPKLKTPFKVFIYCTSVKSLNLSDYVKLHRLTGGALDDWSGKVIGEFTCDWILLDRARENADRIHHEGLIPYDQLLKYGTGKPLYGWHISNLEIYENPVNLSNFGLSRAPQSWCYVEVA